MQHSFPGQGATEYLVLLAVVLIIALVGIALLGFFPGTASDAQIAESQLYWKSASPIAVVEWSIAGTGGWNEQAKGVDTIYLKLRNSGTYPITLKKAVLGNLSYDAYFNFQIYQAKSFTTITMAPGEEVCLGPGATNNDCREHAFLFAAKSSNFTETSYPYMWGYGIHGADQGCNEDGSGQLVLGNFGFEYEERIEGQTITKREIGTKPLIAKCSRRSG